ncbi:MAG: Lrp/AsnC family transcriptional regulator, partial [Pseudomonadota bacterium]|nr:Lrp/AsnC family transcriptional regulator [Pseudomonadota bacterium]
MELDKTDRQILETLQKHGRISNQELAEAVNLSPSPCLRRVKQLEDSGFIDGYVALVNARKLGLTLVSF